MGIEFKRTYDVQMAGLEVAEGFTEAQIVAALSARAATFDFDAKEDVFVIQRTADRKTMGWFKEVEQLASDSQDTNFVSKA